MPRAWTFGLPPTVGNTVASSAHVASALGPLGCRIVRQALNYGALIKDLDDGRVQVAWAPPLVCAIIEEHGGTVLLRSLRQGSAHYRGVLYGRAERKLSTGMLKGLRAAWPDAQSMSGFVLPRAMMRFHAMDPDRELTQRFLGSFEKCVHAVLERQADVSGIYASASSTAALHLGFRDLAGARADELAVIELSPDCPNDGLVLSPRVKSDEAPAFQRAFERFAKDAAAVARLAKALDVDGFDVPGPGTYAPLLSYIGNPKIALDELLPSVR